MKFCMSNKVTIYINSLNRKVKVSMALKMGFKNIIMKEVGPQNVIHLFL